MRSAMFHKYSCEPCLMEEVPVTPSAVPTFTSSSSPSLGRSDGLLPHSRDQIPTSDPCLVPRSPYHNLGHSFAPVGPLLPFYPCLGFPRSRPCDKGWRVSGLLGRWSR